MVDALSFSVALSFKYLTRIFNRPKQIFTWPFINFLTVSYDMIFDSSEARS